MTNRVEKTMGPYTSVYIYLYIYVYTYIHMYVHKGPCLGIYIYIYICLGSKQGIPFHPQPSELWGNMKSSNSSWDSVDFHQPHPFCTTEGKHGGV